ncbi:Uncharacterised protein [Bacillus freudenreichii]|nr:Uncharacterised protein [Bacillus freudenreichii]
MEETMSFKCAHCATEIPSKFVHSVSTKYVIDVVKVIVLSHHNH